jgi:hypothetical protein
VTRRPGPPGPRAGLMAFTRYSPAMLRGSGAGEMIEASTSTRGAGETGDRTGSRDRSDRGDPHGPWRRRGE